MNFSHIKAAVAKQFERMSKYELFRTSISKDDLWTCYLASFPEGSNPIYKTKTEHDCNCCRQFIRAVGNVVAIINGKVESIWDGDCNDQAYAAVLASLSEFVKSAPISDSFLHYEKTAGTNRNLQDTVDGIKTWQHFFVHIPAKFVASNKDIATKLNDVRTAHDVLNRGLLELKVEALESVKELISQNSLYRGEEHKFAVGSFLNLKRQFDRIELANRDAFVWQQVKVVPASVARVFNTSIGTLVTDISGGKELDDAVGSFEHIVAPTNYKRPKALVTKAMIEKAKATIKSLGLDSALERRYATIADITVNSVLFADRSAKKVMTGNPFDDLAASVPVNVKSLDKVEELPIEKFIRDILPLTKSLEVLVENRHVGGFVSLIAPADPTALPLFKWDNNFSWSYNGDVADSIKERVKSAGGSVSGDLCCRLAWFNCDDLDLYMMEPDGYRVYFGTKQSTSPSGGRLDIDMNAGYGETRTPVENIFYGRMSSMKEGVYTLSVNNFCQRETKDTGFEIEIDTLGNVTNLAYNQPVPNKGTVEVAKLVYRYKNDIEVKSSLPITTTIRQVWGVPTQTFRKVSVMMLSPNYWDGYGVGNKHYFFILEGCKNEGQVRGFFNEFLKSDLDAHRKVIELVGAKMRPEQSEQQLSGLGFSSTQRNSVLCKVTGTFTRVIKVTF